jgi:uncharacterized RDD family membrane protein YckC
MFLISKLEATDDIVSLNPSLEYDLIVASLAFTIFLVSQGFFLFKYSQTIGKLATNIKIVGLNNKPISFLKLIVMRYAVLYMISIVPTIGSFILFIGVLLIYTKDRRCLHDLLAGTKVVDLNSLTSQGNLPEEREAA